MGHEGEHRPEGEGESSMLRVCGGEMHEQAVRVRVAGEVDLATAPELEAALDAAIAAGAVELVVDLAGVTFMDSSGIDVLERARRRLRGPGGRVATVGGSRTVRRLLRLYGLDSG